MSTYQEYSDLLKEKDSWNDVIQTIRALNSELRRYATGNGGENVRSHLEKAYDKIMTDKVWEGMDAAACANTIWDIRNDCQRHSNMLTDICTQLENQALDRQHEVMARLDVCRSQLDEAGRAELTVRSITGNFKRN